MKKNNETMNKRFYIQPKIEKIEIDSEISLLMASQGGPGDPPNPHRLPEDDPKKNPIWDT